MYSIRNIIDREEQPEKMYFIPDYNFLGKAAGQNVFHFARAMENPGKGVPYSSLPIRQSTSGSMDTL